MSQPQSLHREKLTNNRLGKTILECVTHIVDFETLELQYKENELKYITLRKSLSRVKV